MGMRVGGVEKEGEAGGRRRMAGSACPCTPSSNHRRGMTIVITIDFAYIIINKNTLSEGQAAIGKLRWLSRMIG